MSRVSVAIATYRRPQMVGQAVESARNQTLEPCEIVVSDDASNDGSVEILKEIAARDPRLKVLLQQSNTGGVRNWNAAMDATTGDFIAWCSDDDRFLEDHLQASVTYLESHPDVGLTHSNFIDAVETGSHCARISRPHRFAKPYRIARQNLIRYLIRYYDWPFHPSTLVMRRAVWEQTGQFNPEYALADTDWFVRAAQRFQVVLLPRHGVLNRRHPGNWSNRLGSARMQGEIFRIVARAIAERWPRNFMMRSLAAAVWRGNVCVRLLLTIGARIRSGQADAAASAWVELLRVAGLGRALWPRSAGDKHIRRLCLRPKTRLSERRGDDVRSEDVPSEELRRSVSPL